MGAAQLQADLYQLRQSGDAAILNPGAGGTFDLRGRDLATVTVTATGTYTLPDSPVGTTLLVCCDDSSGITLADSSGTFHIMNGSSGARAALCIATSSTKWAANEVVNNTIEGALPADRVSFADADGYSPHDDVENALVHLYGRPLAKLTTNATVTSVTPGAGALTGAEHVYWQNNADGALTVTTRTATQLFGDSTYHYAGYSYLLTISNTGDNTVTLAAGAGVTLAGTTTVATTTSRTYLVTFTSATAATITSINKGTIEAT